jgi:putative acetyltransferase
MSIILLITLTLRPCVRSLILFNSKASILAVKHLTAKDLRWHNLFSQDLETYPSKTQSCIINPMHIRIDDLTGPEIAALLEKHIEDMKSVSPPESKHALDLDGLRQRDITFWTIWEDDKLAGCGALKELDSEHGEIKSMRTARTFVRRGVASKVLNHIIGEATKRGYKRLSLETGSMDFFKPAHKLYESFGFTECEAFADYKPDPNSIFMAKELEEKHETNQVV